jgi:hypothetical protein
MPVKKGGKGKKKGKKVTQEQQEILTKAKVLKQLNKSIVSDDNIIWYARVEKAYSGDRIQVTYYSEKDKTGTHKTEIVDVHVSKNLRRIRPKKGDYLLIQPRPFNKSQYDAVLFYNDNDAKKLIKWGEIPIDTNESSIVFVTADEEDDDDSKPLTKSQKRKMRLQQNSQNPGNDYVNMDDIFSNGPGKKSIVHTFMKDEDEEGQNLFEAAVVDIKQKPKDQEPESLSGNSDEDEDIIIDVDDNITDDQDFI